MTSPLDDLFAELDAQLPGAVTRDVPLAGFTTYKLGGPAAVLVRVRAEWEALTPPEQFLLASRSLLGLGR